MLYFVCGMKVARDMVGVTVTVPRDFQTNELSGETVPGCQFSK